eukprot:15431143-Alexandrium_andersonii.AAC.1
MRSLIAGWDAIQLARGCSRQNQPPWQATSIIRAADRATCSLPAAVDALSCLPKGCASERCVVALHIHTHEEHTVAIHANPNALSDCTQRSAYKNPRFVLRLLFTRSNFTS